MNKSEIVFATVSAVLAIGALVFTYLNQRALSKQTKASSLSACLGRYIDTRRLRIEAEKSDKPDLAKQYYRELIDLCWTEFRLWQEGLIPKAVFRCWMDSRYRSFQDKEGIEISDGSGESEKITQESVWKELESKKYFGQHDDFVPFMNSIHGGELDSALRKYRSQKII